MATPVQWLGTFQVNTGIADTPETNNPHIIGLSNGNILVAWEEFGTNGIGTQAGSDIIGKIFDAEGNLVRDSFLLNTGSTEDNEADFDIAPSADGGFYMVYREDETATQTQINWQRYNANGSPIDSLIVADENVAGTLSNPQIVINNNVVAGGHRGYITWTDTTGGEEFIRGAYILEDGTLSAAGIWDAAQNTGGNFNRDGESAILTNGNLVTVYEEEDGANTSIEFYIATLNGAQVANVNVDSGTAVRDPKVASLVNGDFVVVWEDSSNINYAVYTNTGSLVSGPFRTNTSTDTQNEPDVVALPDGGFVIVWDNDTANTVEARAFFASGAGDGSVFTVKAGAGTSLETGVTGDGRILFTWDDQGGDIEAAIWDPRNPATIDSEDYATVPINFVNADVVTGGPGASTIQGDGGPDTLIGSDSADSILGDGGNDLLQGNQGDDTMRGGFAMDTLEGNNGDDQLFGDGGNDSLDGGNNNDTLQGGDGTDTLNGGSGSDTADYSYSFPVGITLVSGWDINLQTQTAVFSSILNPNIESDTLISIENVIGSGWGDTITNSTASNLIRGENGNDTIVQFTNSGVDTFEGGNGTDTLVSDITWVDSVVFDMLLGQIQFSGGVEDFFSGIENLTIGGGADVIGDGQNNRIIILDSGPADNNDIQGGGGNDTIDAGIGSDNVDGGSNDDTIIDRLDGGTSTLNGGSGTDTLDLSGASQGFVLGASGVLTAGTTTLNLNGIETLIGTNQADAIAEIGLNTIDAGGGDDTVTGRVSTGIDTFDGGSGIDTYVMDLATSDSMDLQSGTYDGTANALVNFENAIGNAGNDTIFGTNAHGNDLRGGDGNDSLVGRAGDDTLRGEAGDDTLVGNDDNDSLIGGVGNDSLSGGSGNDYLIGSDDNDTLIGGDGSDTLSGGNHDDSLSGGNQDDTLFGGNGNDTLIGGNQNDYLSGGSGEDSLSGGDGNDTLIGGAGADTLQGFDGDDLIRIDAFDSILNVDGGLGRDQLQLENGRTLSTNALSVYGFEEFRGADGNDSVRGNDATVDYDLGGGAGNDTLEGNALNDSLYGQDGDDRLIGQGGNDYLSGGANDDILFGGADNDTLFGSDGNDTLYGDDGDDYLSGGNQNDTLIGGAGSDTLFGGNGDDRVQIDAFDSILNIDGGAGYDTLVIENGRTFVTNGLSVYGFEAFRGADGNDSVRGNDATVNYDLGGGDGNDTLEGNGGNDTLIGGAGDDVFVFDDNFGNDVITFFSSSNAEKIDLSGVAAITDFTDLVTNHLANSGGLAEIFVGGDTILLQNVAFADVGVGLAYSADDFIF